MKRAAFGLCMATAFAASLAAQAPQAPQTQPPATTPAPQSASPAQTTTGAAGDITITGCLQKGADGAFTLNNVQQDATATGTSGAAAPGATAGAGAAASAGAASAAGATWALKGGDLANHVGHRIAVTGKRAMASASGATSTSGAAGAAGATSADPSAAGRPAATAGSSSSNMGNARTLEVASVKMVAATCP
jgi:hypothetical protein